MTDDEAPREDTTPAEAGLLRHMSVLKAETPQGDPSLPVAVVRRARWQQLVRGPARVAGLLAAALADGVRLAVGSRKQR